ncbi:MAG: 16S rRNA (cytosine(967)-C(5))-methyltransferase RsmB [Candidatus Hydrogenedentes bacterium]|nr:16S rRNA (cytosine(967)-C(5))-methyltransferase RsmB [Candidatus Hydrogenedentota bacterium]
MPADPVRDAAIDVLLRVFDRGVHLDISLDKTLRRKQMADRSRRFATQLVYGTVRFKSQCDFVLQKICHQPLDELPTPILAILRMAIYQSLYCNQVTLPAMVHTSVDLAKKRGHAGTARMVNAILRKAPADLDAVLFPPREEDLVKFLSLRHALPRWMVRMWIEQFGEEKAEQLCASCNVQAKTSIRVNLLKTDAETLLKHLEKMVVGPVKHTPLPEEYAFESAGPLFQSKWFQEGHFTLQDGASMIAARLLEPQPGERVLDVCAAPGSKSAHLVELSGGEAHVLAADANWNRLHQVLENRERLGAEAAMAVLCMDGLRPAVAGNFDAVLVDAPCSGLGTLRRHPDLKWRMTPSDITELAAKQADLLRSAAALCKNGGRIVYSVCTFTPQETHQVVDALLAEGGLELDAGPEILDSWKTSKGKYQTLPSEGELDGFFLTRFRKLS